MTDYLALLDAAAPDQRWPMARQWLYGEPLSFFAQLRAERPVLVTPEVTLATRYTDCSAILRRSELFGVDLYKPKQGSYWMAQGDTAAHWREKSIMRAILDYEELPDMRAFVASTAAAILAEADGRLDIVPALSRATPAALVQKWFGFESANPQSMIKWSYWNQQDAFHNQPFDHAPNSMEIEAERKLVDLELGAFLVAVTGERAIAVKLGAGGDDAVARLLRLAFSGGLKFGVEQVITNVAGLLIGAVETTSHCVVNALEVLFARPDTLAAARACVADADTTAFDGFVFEALRFNPAFPYFFRTCHAPTVLALDTPFATEVATGTTVLAVTHSAMFDETMFPDPTSFEPARLMADEFTFGAGLHECLGLAIGRVMIAEIVRQILLLPDVRSEAPAISRGNVPESYVLNWAKQG